MIAAGGTVDWLRGSLMTPDLFKLGLRDFLHVLSKNQSTEQHYCVNLKNHINVSWYNLRICALLRSKRMKVFLRHALNFDKRKIVILIKVLAKYFLFILWDFQVGWGRITFPLHTGCCFITNERLINRFLFQFSSWHFSLEKVPSIVCNSERDVVKNVSITWNIITMKIWTVCVQETSNYCCSGSVQFSSKISWESWELVFPYRNSQNPIDCQLLEGCISC